MGQSFATCSSEFMNNPGFATDRDRSCSARRDTVSIPKNRPMTVELPVHSDVQFVNSHMAAFPSFLGTMKSTDAPKRDPTSVVNTAAR